MKRSPQFRPTGPDWLEGRVVLSQVYFSPPTGIIDHGKVVHSVLAPPEGYTVHTISRAHGADGSAEIIDETTVTDGVSFANTTKVLRNADGTRQTDRETATISGGTTTFTKAITLANGGHQTESGTDSNVNSLGAVQPDGSVLPGSGMIRTTTFRHTTTQPGLGTQTIEGISTQGKINGHTRTVTNQTVTHFDGSQAAVHVVTTEVGQSTSTQTTTTPVGGSPTTTTSSTRLLSFKHS